MANWYGVNPNHILNGNRCAPDRTMLYVEYRGSDLLSEFRMPEVTEFGTEPFLISGVVIDCRMYQNKGPGNEYTWYMILLKVTQCIDNPKLVDQLISVYNFRDRISVNPITDSISHRRAKALQRLALAKTFLAKPNPETGSQANPRIQNTLEDMRDYYVSGREPGSKPVNFFLDKLKDSSAVA